MAWFNQRVAGSIRGTSLDYYFLYYDGEVDGIDGALEGIIDVLTLHSSRWRNLCLSVDPHTLERISGSMDLNQLLCLHLLVSSKGSSSFSAQKIIMKSKPFPTFLRLDNFSPKSIDIGLNNIMEANLSYLTTDDCAEVLRQAPALERFHVEKLQTPDGPTVHVDSSIIHPRIRSLGLPVEAINLLNMINVPTLEEWTQDACGSTLPATAMVSLLQRSSCCLKILNLQRLSVGLNNFATLFQATPFLEHLEMNFMDRSNGVDDILVRIFHSPPVQSSSHESFLPRLQFLACTTCFSMNALFPWDRIPDLHRLGYRCSLTLKSYANASDTSDETAMELLNLVDEGAKFLIFDSIEGGDFLENSRKRMGTEGR